MDTQPRSLAVEEPAPVALAVAAAAAAAVAGGVAWGLIQRWTGYEVGILAWAIGFATGTAAVLASRGRRGADLQIVAVVTAVVGLLIGKYLGYAFAVQDAVRQLGAEASLFERPMFDSFRSDLDTVFGLYDVLWFGFALWSAWRIPRLRPVAPAE